MANVKVTCSIRMPTFQRQERSVAAEVAADKRAAQSSVKVHKLIVLPKHKKALTRAAGNVRTRFNELVVKTGESEGLVPASFFFKFKEEIDKPISEFDRVREKFLHEYQYSIKPNAESFAGTLYNANDYPSVDVVRGKIGVDLYMLPAPEVADLPEVLREFEEQVQATIENQMLEGQRQLYERLFGRLEHLVETLSDDGKIFRDTTVTKLRELCDFAPQMAVIEDPALEAICEKVKKVISVEPATLRKDVNVRRYQADEARKALEEIEEAMRGVF